MLLLHVVDDRAETETPPSQNVYRQSRSLQVRTSLQRRLLSPSCIAPPCHSALFACHRGIGVESTAGGLLLVCLLASGTPSRTNVGFLTDVGCCCADGSIGA